MNINRLITPLLLCIPIASGAATVSDFSILDKVVSNETFVKLKQEQEQRKIENTGMGSGSERGSEAEFHAHSNMNKIVVDNTEFTPSARFAPNTSQINFLDMVHDKIAGSNDLVWQDLTVSVKQLNDSLNQVDIWAANFLNDNTTNTDLASINFRNELLKQENANIKSFINEQDANSNSPDGQNGNTYINTEVQSQYDFLKFFITPGLLIKALAENFSLLVVGFSLLMGFRLLLKFILEKTKKRQRRRKGRRKRSIDGFIN